MKKFYSRRDFIKTTLAGTFAAGVVQRGWGEESATSKEPLVFIGTYTSGKSKGIYTYRFDSSTGALAPAADAMKADNPSFLAIHPQKKYLYAVNEVSQFNGRSGGSVSAYSIDSRSGALTLLNQQPSHGQSPCYISVDHSGKWIFIANYSSGNIAMYPIQEEGKIGPSTSVIQHTGSSVVSTRQQEPHAHCILPDPTNRYVYACDLGIDKIMIYQLDSGNGILTANTPPSVSAQPGAGPRHFTFHPNGKFAFLIQEINSTLTSYSYDSSNGTLKEVETVSTLPEGYTGTSYCADVHVSPSGKFLYGSNRGHDSIAIFAIDDTTGKLALVGHQSTLGKTPRNFAIDPTGTFLLAANQDSSTVVSFRIDSVTGTLEPTGTLSEIPNPVCLVFF